MFLLASKTSFSFSLVGDCSAYIACNMFLNSHLDILINKGGHKHFIVHVTNMHQFGLLSAKQVLSLTSRLAQAKQKKLIFR